MLRLLKNYILETARPHPGGSVYPDQGGGREARPIAISN